MSCTNRNSINMLNNFSRLTVAAIRGSDSGRSDRYRELCSILQFYAVAAPLVQLFVGDKLTIITISLKAKELDTQRSGVFSLYFPVTFL